MEKVFAEIFSKQPDEITDGDYFYHLPWYEDIAVIIAESMGMSPKELRERQEKAIKTYFESNWKAKTLHDESAAVYTFYNIDNFWAEDMKFKEALNKIAIENKPFMDIASSENMGLAPYIIKTNPKIPCLLTDIDAHGMKCLRSCIDENITEYNVSIASFDNNDIPIKDDSLEYITSMRGVESSCGKPAAEQITYSYPFQHSIGKEKVIDEVYRILKPGGRFVTIEMNMECDYDLQKIYNNYNEHGKLFGIYTYDEIQAALALLIEEPWRDKFISAGFQVEVEEKQYQKHSIDDLKRFLYSFTYYNKIREWTDEERVLYSMAKIKGVPSKQTIEETLNELLRAKINYPMSVAIISSLTKIENNRSVRLSSDEIKNIMRNYIQSDEPNEYTTTTENINDTETEDIGIDLYLSSNFYVLRKSD